MANKSKYSTKVHGRNMMYGPSINVRDIPTSKINDMKIYVKEQRGTNPCNSNMFVPVLAVQGRTKFPKK